MTNPIYFNSLESDARRSIHNNILTTSGAQGCARFGEILVSAQVLWSLCSVDFHTFTLQLPIQTPHSVAPGVCSFY